VAAIGLAFDGRCGSGSELDWVLRTACASISRSSVFVFGDSRGIDVCQYAMDDRWGLAGEN
jgi:hypothetical protein